MARPRHRPFDGGVPPRGAPAVRSRGPVRRGPGRQQAHVAALGVPRAHRGADGRHRNRRPAGVHGPGTGPHPRQGAYHDAGPRLVRPPRPPAGGRRCCNRTSRWTPSRAPHAMAPADRRVHPPRRRSSTRSSRTSASVRRARGTGGTPPPPGSCSRGRRSPRRLHLPRFNFLPGLPDPEFKQDQTGSPLVRFTLRNKVHQRRVWVDKDVGDLVGLRIAKPLSVDRKRRPKASQLHVDRRENDARKAR